MMCQNIYSQIKQWTLKLRRKDKFEIIFQNLDIANETTMNNNNIQQMSDPIPTHTKYTPVSSTKKRKISSFEAKNTRIRCLTKT